MQREGTEGLARSRYQTVRGAGSQSLVKYEKPLAKPCRTYPLARFL